VSAVNLRCIRSAASQLGRCRAPVKGGTNRTFPTLPLCSPPQRRGGKHAAEAGSRLSVAQL